MLQFKLWLGLGGGRGGGTLILGAWRGGAPGPQPQLGLGDWVGSVGWRAYGLDGDTNLQEQKNEVNTERQDPRESPNMINKAPTNINNRNTTY